MKIYSILLCGIAFIAANELHSTEGEVDGKVIQPVATIPDVSPSLPPAPPASPAPELILPR